jgi:hypothetical protein
MKRMRGWATGDSADAFIQCPLVLANRNVLIGYPDLI